MKREVAWVAAAFGDVGGDGGVVRSERSRGVEHVLRCDEKRGSRTLSRKSRSRHRLLPREAQNTELVEARPAKVKSAAAGVHLGVWLLLQLGGAQEWAPRFTQCQPVFGAAIAAGRPVRSEQRREVDASSQG